MKVSYNWLMDYVDVDLSPQELAQRLTARGVVVETLTYANPGVEGVVVGRVLEIERHPNADTLWVCQVDVGGGRVLQILTGAQNVTRGALVPAAIPGSRLPGMTMEVKVLRGLESHGMLASEAELGVGDDGDGIMILPPEEDLEPGMDVAEVLGLNDWILELDLTANYAAHCQSMIGVAQEVAALVGGEVILPEIYTEEEPGTSAQRMVSIAIEEPALCDRYAARIVRGVKVGPSPAWLQARIRAAGMRPINNIVDISNFVMMELGQPLHTFDYNKLKHKRIIVRRARAGEQITTLDEQVRTLDPDVLLITDNHVPVAMAGVMGDLYTEVDEKTVDILIESAHFNNINNRRTALKYNLPSEAAKRFTKGVDPSGQVRAADRAAQLIAELGGGRVVQGHVDVYPAPSAPPVIPLRTARVNELLGLSLPTERMAVHLRNLGFAVLSPVDLAADLAAGAPGAEEEVGADLSGRPVWTAIHQVSPLPTDPEAYSGWAQVAWAAVERAGEQLEAYGEQEVLVVVVPTRRLDIAVEIDLVEEIARSEGYDAIPLQLPRVESFRGGRTPLAQQVLGARRLLAGAGLTEVMTHSLIHPRVYDRLGLPEGHPARSFLQLANPMYEERSTLRTLLLPGILDVLSYNVNRQIRDLAVFEISQVYRPVMEQTLPDEPPVLAIALMGNLAPLGWNSPERPADYYALKGYVELLLRGMDVQGWSVERGDHPSFHPGRQAALLVGGQVVGHLGELHPKVQEAWDLPGRVYVAEIAFRPLVEAARPQREYGAVPRFPAVSRDVAMLVGLDLPASRVEEAIRQAGGELLEEVTLFDLYQGERLPAGKRSLAYRLTYRAADRTLTDADLEPVHNRVREALRGLGAELRS
ncbi:MAG: phenylalanine--tRNA ligase subunit beta [Bacillota bacterium]